jgi:hypothetical protein
MILLIKILNLKQLLENTTDEADRSNINNRAIDYTKRTSINFIGVRKQRSPEQKTTHFLKISPFTIV